MMESQLDYFRGLVREVLIPLLVKPNPDQTEMVCGLCHRPTPVDELPVDSEGKPSRLGARHTTYCRLKSASEVWE